MAIDAVHVGVPSLEEFSRLSAVSTSDHCSPLPIETVIALKGVRKHKRKGTTSAEHLLVFISAILKTSASSTVRSFAHAEHRPNQQDVGGTLGEPQSRIRW
ncbi:hypothetical protein SprV_0100379100 [Sparganum proliferum]